MNPVVLATDHRDCIVPASKADEIAHDLADQHGQTVTIRHPVTDRVIRRVKPTTKPR